MNPAFMSAITQQAGSGHRIAFIGDSTTEWGFIPRFKADGFAGIYSDAENVGGEGTVTIYDDSTICWAAAGDTNGPRTAFEYDRKQWYESGTENKGVCIILPSAFAGIGSPEGTPVPLTMIAQDEMGGRDQAPHIFGQIFTGQRFAVTGEHGYAGQRAEEILARLSDAWTKNTFGRPLARKPTHLVILVGINDVAYISGDAPYGTAEVKGLYNAMRDAVLAEGIKPIFGNLVDEDTAPETVALIDELNAHLASIAVADSVYVVDYHAACNGVAGAMSGSHYTTLGAKLAGAKLAELLVSIAGQGASRFALGSSGGNLVENGELSGTSGALTGMTGAAAVDSTFTGSGTCVASKQAVSDQCDKQVYTITGASAGDELLVEFDPLWAIGQRIFGGIDVEVTGDGVSGVDCYMSFTNAGNTRTETFNALSAVSNHDMGELHGIFKTPTIAVPSYYDSGRFYFKAILSAGDSVIKIQNAGVMAV